MASTPEFVRHAAEQLGLAGIITCRKMFGEYGLYCDGRFFAVICDDRLFLKPTAAGLSCFAEPVLAPPYPGAGDMLLVEDLSDRGFLRELVIKTCAALPAKKPRRKSGPDR